MDKQNPPLYLPAGTVLSDRYLVGRVLYAGGDLAEYIGLDQVSKSPIVIREFLPDTLCTRGDAGELQILGGCENTFADYLGKFRSHARALARMRDLPSVIPLYDIFEQNHTAYTVAEYCEGISLETRLAQAGGRLRWDEVRPLFMTLMTSLTSLHAAGILHLGISPENILIGTDGKFRLRGFSIAEARQVSTDLKPQLLAGYSAPEQYGFDQTCTASADVYAMAATIFRTVTGNPPPEGPAAPRIRPTCSCRPMWRTACRTMWRWLCSTACRWIRRSGRPAWRPCGISYPPRQRSAPCGRTRTRAGAHRAEPAPQPEEPEEKPKNPRTKYAVLIVVAVFVVLLLFAGGVLLILSDSLFGDDSSSEVSTDGLPTISTSQQGTTAPVEHEKMYAVSDVMGKNYYKEKDKEFNGKMKLEVEYLAYSDQAQGHHSQPESPQPGQQAGGNHHQSGHQRGAGKGNGAGRGGLEAGARPEAAGGPRLQGDGGQGAGVAVRARAGGGHRSGCGVILDYGSAITLRVSDVERPPRPRRPRKRPPPRRISWIDFGN